MLGKKPVKTWSDAKYRWVQEMQHKRSLVDDVRIFDWLEKHLEKYRLDEINKDVIEMIALEKEKEKREEKTVDGEVQVKVTKVKPATVNRMLALIRSVLNRAYKQWEWIDRAPVVRMRAENNARIKWLTREQATLLLCELPKHLRDMARLSLSTGLRESNIRELKWLEVDLVNKQIIIPAEKSKNKKPLNAPLNNEAVQVIKEQIGEHDVYVFTYMGRKVWQCSTRAWRKALKRAGINDFRWHDLRHTWASWHVQSGTTLQELFELGGWSSFEMVLRYAHLSSNHLQDAANRISGAKMVKSDLKVVEK